MQVRQRNPQYADNPMIMNLFEQQVGQQLVQQQVMLARRRSWAFNVTSEDVRQYLETGPAGQVLFPNGKFIGQQQYAAIIESRFDISVAEFEENVKNDIAIRRLESLITAGVTVSDKEVRDAYRKSNIKIKFDYAVISGDDLRKQINPSDAELEAFFKKNAARYATAVPEERTISYFAFHSERRAGRCAAADTAGDSAVLQRAPGGVFGAGTGAFAAHPDQRACGCGCQDRCGGQGQGGRHSEAAEERRQLRGSGQEEFRRPGQQGYGR